MRTFQLTVSDEADLRAFDRFLAEHPNVKTFEIKDGPVPPPYPYIREEVLVKISRSLAAYEMGDYIREEDLHDWLATSEKEA